MKNKLKYNKNLKELCDQRENLVPIMTKVEPLHSQKNISLYNKLYTYSDNFSFMKSNSSNNNYGYNASPEVLFENRRNYIVNTMISEIFEEIRKAGFNLPQIDIYNCVTQYYDPIPYNHSTDMVEYITTLCIDKLEKIYNEVSVKLGILNMEESTKLSNIFINFLDYFVFSISRLEYEYLNIYFPLMKQEGRYSISIDQIVNYNKQLLDFMQVYAKNKMSIQNKEIPRL